MIRKLINDPAQVVSELLAGLELASNGMIRNVGPVGAMASTALPESKVGLLIGGDAHVSSKVLFNQIALESHQVPCRVRCVAICGRISHCRSR